MPTLPTRLVAAVEPAPATATPAPVVLAAAAAPDDFTCGTRPLGALEPARPFWCAPPGPAGPSTFAQTANGWLDDFNHGLSNSDGLGAGYRVFDDQLLVHRTQHWRHSNHWMMDLAPLDAGGNGLLGGASMRPDRSFRFQDGKLVVETDYAAGIAEYGGDAWGEITVTTAPAPTGVQPDSLYHYGEFGGAWSFGCRLHAERATICALYNPDGADGDPALFGTPAGRVWEMSGHQHVGATAYGGTPFEGRENLWRTCAGTDPDTNCRDRFRLELTRDSVTIYVNGGLYLQQTGLRVPFPDALVDGDVYVYLAGWEVRAQQPVRFHWDRLAVNPTTGPSAAPGFGGPVPPTATAVPAPPTATRTATPAPPTATAAPPTATAVAATATPTATAVAPGPVATVVCLSAEYRDGVLTCVPQE